VIEIEMKNLAFPIHKIDFYKDVLLFLIVMGPGCGRVVMVSGWESEVWGSKPSGSRQLLTQGCRKIQ